MDRDDHTRSAIEPVPMLLRCPECGERHVDRGRFATKPHHTHACQHCGAVWRPAIVPTVGVDFLPGFKDEPSVVECPHCGGGLTVDADGAIRTATPEES